MRKIMIRIGAVVFAFVLCMGLFAGCGSKDKADTDVTGTGTQQVSETVDETQQASEEVTGTGENGTGTEKLTIEDLYGDMTEEEIAQFHKDLEDLGMTPDDILEMLYS